MLVYILDIIGIWFVFWAIKENTMWGNSHFSLEKAVNCYITIWCLLDCFDIRIRVEILANVKRSLLRLSVLGVVFSQWDSDGASTIVTSHSPWYEQWMKHSINSIAFSHLNKNSHEIAQVTMLEAITLCKIAIFHLKSYSSNYMILNPIIVNVVFPSIS